MNDQILTRDEVMKRLRIGRTAFQRLVHEDPDFKTVKMGHRRVMRESALQRFLEAKENER